MLLLDSMLKTKIQQLLGFKLIPLNSIPKSKLVAFEYLNIIEYAFEMVSLYINLIYQLNHRGRVEFRALCVKLVAFLSRGHLRGTTRVGHFDVRQIKILLQV